MPPPTNNRVLPGKKTTIPANGAEPDTSMGVSVSGIAESLWVVNA